MSLLRSSQQNQLAEKAHLVEKAREILENAWSGNTKRAYRSMWQSWQAWRKQHEVAEPPTEEAFMLYLTHLVEQEKKLPTLNAALVAIRHGYEAAQTPLPPFSGSFQLFRQGLRRQLKHKPIRKKPMTLGVLDKGLRKCFWEPWEQALLQWGFATGFRRSELVSLRLTDITSEYRGLLISLSASKTNQEGKEETIAIPAEWRDFTALLDWYKQRREQHQATQDAGWLFPSPRDANAHVSEKTFVRIVKRAAEAQGLNAADFAGHSCRAGLATSLAEADVDIRRIAQQLRHKDPLRTTTRYIRTHEQFSKNPLKDL